MSASFHSATSSDDNNAVGMLNGRQAMCYNQCCPTNTCVVQRMLNDLKKRFLHVICMLRIINHKSDVWTSSISYLFTLRIQGWSCFIQQKYFRITNQSSSYGNSLFLPSWYKRSFVTNHCIVTLDHLRQENLPWTAIHPFFMKYNHWQYLW